LLLQWKPLQLSSLQRWTPQRAVFVAAQSIQIWIRFFKALMYPNFLLFAALKQEC